MKDIQEKIKGLEKELKEQQEKMEALPKGTLKVTTAHYYTMDGISPHYRGVVPDIILPVRADTDEHLADSYEEKTLTESNLINHRDLTRAKLDKMKPTIDAAMSSIQKKTEEEFIEAVKKIHASYAAESVGR